MGALQEALEPVTTSNSQWNTLYFEIRTTLWNTFRIASIPSWNDSLPDDTGKVTVVSTLRDVADCLDARMP